MRGVQEFEQRSRPTNIRGRIYIYASLGRYPRADEAAWAEEYGLVLGVGRGLGGFRGLAFDIDALPRGVIVGSVELVDCDGNNDEGFEWLLLSPRRFALPIKPKRRANPVWFRPFG